ncbi:MAG: serine/threonine-protein kinase [Alphaproteobacteria bacterium]
MNINTQIKKYKIVSKIADGGMGAVYKAIDTELRRDVAVKVIHKHFLPNASVRARFIDEARIQAKLIHPNICVLFDAFDYKNKSSDKQIDEDIGPVLVMEYVDGVNLKELIKKKGKIPEKEAVKIILKVLEALKVAHKNDVVHRDIKPSNIMITLDGDVKVMDFGIAKSLTGERVSETKTGVKVGTPEYMSPEQITGKKIDARTDIYSLGIIFYEMLTGKLPFDGVTSEFEIQKFHVEKPMPLLVYSAAWFNEIISKATGKLPEERFQSAEDFQLELKNYFSEVKDLTRSQRKRFDKQPKTMPMKTGNELKNLLLLLDLETTNRSYFKNVVKKIVGKINDKEDVKCVLEIFPNLRPKRQKKRQLVIRRAIFILGKRIKNNLDDHEALQLYEKVKILKKNNIVKNIIWGIGLFFVSHCLFGLLFYFTYLTTEDYIIVRYFNINTRNILGFIFVLSLWDALFFSLSILSIFSYNFYIVRNKKSINKLFIVWNIAVLAFSVYWTGEVGDAAIPFFAAPFFIIPLDFIFIFIRFIYRKNQKEN